MKKCIKCGIIKDKKEFYKNKKMKDGLLSICKKCSIKYALNWIDNHKEQRTIYSRLWSRENNESVNQTKRKYRLKNRIKVLQRAEKYRRDNRLKCKARSYLNNAIRDKKLQRPDTCELCNKIVGQANIRADHYKGYDMSNWFNVQWICIKCDSKQLRVYK